ncbi:MAG: prephenate dehydratase [Nitriliruptorales bacterium]|nr:prephenate dehydratase [Nitriliruptorales bacterium]
MTRVAFLGPDGTFTSQAAVRAAPDGDLVPKATISDVIAAVRDGDVPLGVVPMENSIEGSVNVTLDDLAFGPAGAYIRAEITIPIAMNLLAKTGSALEDITTVRSQPHALAQCRRWLSDHLPTAELQAATSTAEAAREAAAGDGSVAALGPAVAAERFGLEVRAADVHDHDGNTTRFVVLSASMAARTGADKTSIVVFFGEDRPGLLLRILDEFALRGINLTKIESRPTKQALGEYCIFIDCAGHVTDARVAEALRSVHRHAADVRILGSYARADGVVDGPGPADSDAAYAEAADWYARLTGDVSNRI